jgi:hypothetical protein
MNVEADIVQHRQHAISLGHMAHLKQMGANKRTSLATWLSSSSGTPR